MKLVSLSIIDYGKFTDKMEIPVIDPRIALFYGKNEAGKTTIFNLIRSLLYGFSPAKCDTHPYSSRKNGRIEFSARLSTKEGEAEVYRRLLSAPKGLVTVADRLLDLKNNPLPYASHISPEIFNKVYSLKVEDLIEIQGKAWEDVQDKLLANYGSELIKSPREVLKEIYEDAAQIYRESGKGNYIVKELENNIKELKREKADAAAREGLLRKYSGRLAEIQELLERLNIEKVSIKASLKKSKEIIPVMQLLAEIDELKGKLVKVEQCDSIPAGVKEHMESLAEIRRQLTTEITRKQKTIEDKQGNCYLFTPADTLVLSSKLKIDAYLRDIGKLTAAAGEIHKLKTEIEKTNTRLTEEGRVILNDALTGEILYSINRLNFLELQAVLGRGRKLRQELQEKRGLLSFKSEQRPEIKKSKAYTIAAAVGIPLLLLALLIGNTPATLISGFIALFGITGILNAAKIKQQYAEGWTSNSDISKLQAEINSLADELSTNKSRIAQLLKAIPVPEIIVEESQDVFLSGMMRMKDLSLLLEEKNRELKNIEENHQALIKEIKGFLQLFSFDNATEVENDIYSIKDKLENLEKQKALNESLQQELQRLQSDLSEKQLQLEETEDKLNSYLSKLEAVGDGNAENGLIIHANHVRLKSKLRILEDRLSEIPSLRAVLHEIELMGKVDEELLNDIEVEKNEIRLEEIDEELKNVRVEKKEIEINMQALLAKQTLAEIESNISVLEEELAAACLKRDKLALLAEIIKRADEEFKEENQPDVLKNASRYFSLITNGRYSSILLEDNEGAPAMYIKETNNSSPRRVGEYESKGTINQLYLSLRLSLIDHLDQNQEALPICFDELLINWDEERLENNLKLLEEISAKRQIFIFTCHGWMAEKIEKHFKVQRIALEQMT